MRVLIAGGGTGGHLFPGFAVARSLRQLRSDAEIAWLGGQRGIERRVVPAEGYALTLLAAPSLRPAQAGRLSALRDAIALLRSIPQAIGEIRRLRPDVLFTTGGYVAIPALIAAALTRTPSVIWEGNVEAGRSNRLIAPLATARAVAWAETRARAPWDGAGTHLTGTPVRDLSGTSRAAARAELGLADGDRLLLVFGGSQRVLRFEQALDGALAAILPRWKVLHVTGTDGVGAEARRAALPAELRDRYRTTAFLERGEMERALVASDLLLGRAGASTIAEASAVGLPSIIVPYPYAGGHQRANAAALADAGGATLVADRDLTAERLVAAIAPFDDVAHRARVGAAARALAHPEAARTIAELLVDTAAARAPRGRRP